jgi:hypothetical protein
MPVATAKPRQIVFRGGSTLTLTPIDALLIAERIAFD